MTPKLLLQTFRQTFVFALDHPNSDAAHRAINLHHYGNEEVPLNISCKQLTPEHQDAAYSVCRGRVVAVELDFYSDGTFKVRTV